MNRILAALFPFPQVSVSEPVTTTDLARLVAEASDRHLARAS